MYIMTDIIDCAVLGEAGWVQRTAAAAALFTEEAVDNRTGLTYLTAYLQHR